MNLTEGGPLTVLRDCLAAAREVLDPSQPIIAVVHDRRLFDQLGVRFVEFPESKSSWRRRLSFEYREFRRLSHEWQPALWLSLHDASPLLAPNVPQAVYCHNTTPLFRPRFSDVLFEPTLLVFRLLYGLVYRFNLRSNALVIVQQDWLREVFIRKYGAKRVLVAHPSVGDLVIAEVGQPRSDCPPVLLYPTLSRAFKNVETVCRAFVDAKRRGFAGKLRVTIDGTENRYARFIARHFGSVEGIELIGRQDRAAMAVQYQECTAVLFPSRLETWGLPITEAKGFGKPLIVADLPYARETVGDYDKVRFVPVTDWRRWSNEILMHGNGSFAYAMARTGPPEPPFVTGWLSLWDFLATEFDLRAGDGPNTRPAA